MTQKKTPKEQISTLTIKVERMSPRIEALINHEVWDARERDDNTQVYKFSSEISYEGICVYPPELSNHSYHINVYSADSESLLINARLKNFHQKDSEGQRQYRRVRAREMPVYKIPAGIGLLNKERGSAQWNGWIWVPEQILSNMLILANSGKQLFLEIVESRVGRKRWIRNLIVQTTDPNES